MKKVILASAIVLGLSGCAALTPAENVQALRQINKAELRLEVAKDLKIEADKRAECATIRVHNAEVRLEEAKQKFEEVYQK